MPVPQDQERGELFVLHHRRGRHGTRATGVQGEQEKGDWQTSQSTETAQAGFPWTLNLWMYEKKKKEELVWTQELVSKLPKKIKGEVRARGGMFSLKHSQDQGQRFNFAPVRNLQVSVPWFLVELDSSFPSPELVSPEFPT